MTREEGAIEQALRIVRRRKVIVLQALIGVPLIALAAHADPGEGIHRDGDAAVPRDAGRRIGESQRRRRPDPRSRHQRRTGGAAGGRRRSRRTSVNDAIPRRRNPRQRRSRRPSANADTAAISATTTSPERSADIANAYGNAYISFRRKADRTQVQDAIDLAEAEPRRTEPGQREGAAGRSAEQTARPAEARPGAADRRRRAGPARLAAVRTVLAEPHPQRRPRDRPRRPARLRPRRPAGAGRPPRPLQRRDGRALRAAAGRPHPPQPPARREQRPRGSARRRWRGRPSAACAPTCATSPSTSDLQSLLIVSPEEGDGKSTVARGLAMTMAEMGDHVVLVEADLRKGSEFRQVTGQPADGPLQRAHRDAAGRGPDPRPRAAPSHSTTSRAGGAAERPGAAQPLGAAGEPADARGAGRAARAASSS